MTAAMTIHMQTPKSQPTQQTSSSEKLDSWCLVELFGHQKIVGKVTEATIAGGAFIRVDVPEYNGSQPYTRFYGPGAIYSINPVSEQIARDLMDRYRNVPVQRYELPMLAEKNEQPAGGPITQDDGWDDDEGDSDESLF